MSGGVSLNTRPAPRNIKREIERRLKKTTPGAELVWEPISLCAIPHTNFDATIFMYRQNKRVVMVAELARPGLPHIYKAFAVHRDPRRNFQNVVIALASLSKSVLTDPRFRRNVVSLNGNGSAPA